MPAATRDYTPAASNAISGGPSDPSRVLKLVNDGQLWNDARVNVGLLQVLSDQIARLFNQARIDVRSYGALGDGAHDDTSSFVAALAALEAVGGGTLFVPAGVYMLHGAISVPSSVTIVGEGIDATTLKATAGPSAPWTNVPGQALVEFRGVDHAGMRDLTVHGNGHLRTPGSGGDPLGDNLDELLIIAGSQRCSIERVRFTEAGWSSTMGSSFPSGPAVLIVSKDVANDIGGQFGSVAFRDCSGNVIRDCVIDDGGGAARVSKGLGIITDFGTLLPLTTNKAFNLSRTQTTIAGSVSVGDTSIHVTSSLGIELGSSLRLERASDVSIFDVGYVVAIVDSTHVTINVSVTHTYSASDKIGVCNDAYSPFAPGTAPSPFAAGDRVASSLRGRAVDLAGDGRGRMGVSALISGSMSSSATTVKAPSLGICLGDTVRVARASDPTLYDEGIVTSIPDLASVVIGTPTTRTYSASDTMKVTAFSSVGGFNGGDYYATHSAENVIEGCTFQGVFNLYAAGIQGGGACRNTVRKNNFKSVRGLNCVLVDKGAYSNTIEDNTATDHQRDTALLTSSPIASFVGRSLAGYYDVDNTFRENKVVAFVGTLAQDAPFAVGENSVNQVWEKNKISGAFVPGNSGFGMLLGQGNIDPVIDGNKITGTDYGIISNLGGPPQTVSVGGLLKDNTIDVTHQAILLSATANGRWLGALKIQHNVVSGTTDVAGHIAVDSSIDVALLHHNYAERRGTPGGGHIGIVIDAKDGSVSNNVAKGHATAYQFTTNFQGVQSDNRAIGSTVADVAFGPKRSPLFSRLLSALPQATTRIVEVVSVANIAPVGVDGNPIAINGIAISDGEQVLLTGQTAGVENTIWTVRTGTGVTWDHSYDLQAGSPAGGLLVVAKTGTNAGVWHCSNTSGADIVGSSSLTWGLVATEASYTKALAAYVAAVTNATPNNVASVLVQRDGSGKAKFTQVLAADFDDTALTLVRLGFNSTSTRVGTPGGNLGFYGVAGGTTPTITGSRGGNAALASLLTALAGLGLLVDSSS